ncbi:natural killer cell receptor 2B4-like isoform X2 [Sardina pilchardus]|uniref:natural killer cell receptor 2B4-like isoform X1 n=1 Tax=Sardina pilchardus TaxID=27697 RepID=UPI002E116467
MFLLLLIGLISTTGPTVSAAELFVLEGASVTLNATGHEDKTGLKFITWKFHKRPVVVYTHKYNDADVRDPFKGRAEFDVSTFSLLLKNLQRSDSGLYTAVWDAGETEDVAEYELSVLEPAAAPTLTVVSNWSSSDSCNVTLECTGLNVSLISSCNGTFCSQEGGDTSLSISLNHNTVSCNHSNPVSWRHTTLDLKPLCFAMSLKKGDLAPSAGMSPCLLKTLLVTVVLIAMVTAVITVHIRQKVDKAK